MSDENKPELLTPDQVEELFKSREQTLLTKAREEIKAELKKEQLEKDTTELVKSLNVVKPDSVVPLVKALTSIKGEFGGEILKCIIEMDELVKSAKAEAEEVKAWFGPRQDSQAGTPSTQKGEYASNKAEARTQELDEIVKTKLAEKVNK